MELPPAKEKVPRIIDGEMMYLGDCRRQKVEPVPYDMLTEMAVNRYETEADMYRAQGITPDIFGEYERADERADPLCRQAIALADAFLAHRRPETRLTFENFVVPDEASALDRLIASSVGCDLLASPDDQLAIASTGEHYPILDVRRRDLSLNGVGIRVWGWDHPRVEFTNPEGKQYAYPEDCLEFPAHETSPTRQIDISLSYDHPEAGFVSESVTLYVSESSAHLHSQYWMSAYAETGYEGHGGKRIEPTDERMIEFIELVAHIAGDEPMTVAAHDERRLEEVLTALDDTAYGAKARSLLESTWTQQALYELNERRHESIGGITLYEALMGKDEAVKQRVDVFLNQLIGAYTQSYDERELLGEGVESDAGRD